MLEPGDGALLPCYFFKNGAAEMETWIVALCNAVRDAMEDTTSWPPGVGAPAAVIVSAEDIREASVNWETYTEYKADTARAGDSTYKIDISHNLTQWDAEFARHRDGATLSLTPVSGYDYSPENEDLHSYLQSTLQTAYNHAREKSTWRHFRSLWPRAHLSQYQLGNRYGVTVEVGVDHVEVPVGPGESYYHGTRNWKGPVAWDAYYCLTNPYHGYFVGPDGGFVPLSYESATWMEGIASGGTTTTVVVSQFEDAFSPGFYLAQGIPLFVQFTTGANAYPVTIYPVASWAGSTFTLPPGTSLAAAPSADDDFVVYYPSTSGFEFLHDGVQWPLLRTFCNLYFPPTQALSSSMFLETAKKWAAEQAREQTRSLPDNPYTVYYGPGAYPGLYGDPNGLKVSFLATYPEPSFTAPDGWLSGEDWGQVGRQAMNYGVNDFVWYVPPFVYNTGTPEEPVYVASDTVPVVKAAIETMNDTYWQRLAVYQAMLCIADWDQNGEVEQADHQKFGANWFAGLPETDFDNDGEQYDEDDRATFQTAFDSGDCGSIVNIPIPENCVADWCQDGAVGVPDIFCFLSAWFANDPAARNFGGSPGVPAIFAFLAAWFATPMGPCPP